MYYATNCIVLQHSPQKINHKKALLALKKAFLAIKKSLLDLEKQKRHSYALKSTLSS